MDKFAFGGATRAHGGPLQRFVSTVPHARREEAALPASHPAVVEGRTLFPTRVFKVKDAPRLLVGGHNSAKIGARITKGAWKGLPVFTLTLEERKTCPTTCGLWRECYGNAMPLARRHEAGSELVRGLTTELRALMKRYPKGIAVRLHILGDFYSAAYVRCWHLWMNALPKLRVWGYTAHQPSGEIGQLIADANRLWPDRWRVRFSVEPGGALGRLEATTIWRKPGRHMKVSEGLVCPAQTHQTAACATCGLCWAPVMDETRIVFVGHGKRHAHGRRPGPRNDVERSIASGGGVRAVAAVLGLGDQAVLRWGRTDHVPSAKRVAFAAACDGLARSLGVPLDHARADGATSG